MTGIGNGSCEAGKQVFLTKNQALKNRKHCYTYTFPIVFRIVEQFQKGAQLQRSVDVYSGVLFDF